MHRWEQLNIFFTKQDLVSSSNCPLETLNSRIHRALNSRRLIQVKKGLYINGGFYMNEPEKINLSELIASKLYAPSYLSLEYVLYKHNLLFQNQPILTSISIKANRLFTNTVGVFKYSRIKKFLYFGFEKVEFKGEVYHIATKAKALFDYFYLKPDLHIRNFKRLKRQISEESGIQWANFLEEDFKQFDQYVWKSNIKKMMTVLRAVSEYFEGKKFDSWAKDLLNS